MKNQLLEHEREVPGGMTNRDLTAQLGEHLDTVFDDRLEEAVIELKRRIDAANARLLTLIAELDRREIPQNEHVLSTTTWLRRFCRMTGTEASRTTKTARALTRMPHVAKQAATGTIPPASMRMLATAHDKHPDEFAVHETVFAEAATYLDTAQLRRTISYWEQQVDYPSSLGDAKKTRERRCFYLHQTYQGMWNAAGDLDPESGHIIATALNGHQASENLNPEDTRTAPQRRADALTDICRFWLDHNDDVTTSGGERPHVTVTVPYTTLTGEKQRLAEIDGTAVDPETIRRLACDAGIVRIVTDGESQPLDIGRRTRTVPTAIRRALELRDQGCTWPGCDAPISWCDAHHITHWADGGPTSLNNLTLLCRRHHTTTHDGKHPPDR